MTVPYWVQVMEYRYWLGVGFVLCCSYVAYWWNGGIG